MSKRVGESALKYFYLAALIFSMTGCATILKAPDQDTEPSDSTGLMYGRSVMTYNGKILKFDDKKDVLQSGIVNHLSPFISVDTINLNAWVAGKWSIKSLTNNDGYFAAVLPPGRYYIVEFGYVQMMPGVFGIRSYMPILSNESLVRFVATFEVLPGKATYLGTQHHVFNSCDDQDKCAWRWSYKVLDDSEVAGDWLRENYPRWAQLNTTGLIQQQRLD